MRKASSLTMRISTLTDMRNLDPVGTKLFVSSVVRQPNALQRGGTSHASRNARIIVLLVLFFLLLVLFLLLLVGFLAIQGWLEE